MADELEKKADEIIAELRGGSGTTSAAKISKPKGLRDKLVNFLRIGNKENNTQLDGILGILKKDNQLDKKESADARKERQRQKREKREKLIESLKGGAGAAANAGKKIVGTLVSPFKDVWEKIANFLKFTVIGVLFNSALNWFGKPENQEKMQNIGRFFKFWWPSLLAGYALFFTPIGSLVSGVAGILAVGLPALVGLIAGNPILAAAVAAGGLMLGAKILDGDFSGKELTEEQKIESKEKANKIMDMGTLSFNRGGVVPGKGDTDSVPAMLTPGELVIPAAKSGGSIETKGNFLPVKAKGMVPVSIPIRVRSESKTVVLPEIKQEGSKQNFREGSTIPTFNVASSSPSREITLMSLNIEEVI